MASKETTPASHLKWRWSYFVESDPAGASPRYNK